MSLRSLREDIVTALGLAVPAFDHLPERVNPPVAVVGAGSPYVERGDTFGSFRVRWDVVLVVSSGQNDRATDDLDDLVEQAIQALARENYTLDAVSQPYALLANNAEYPAVRISISDAISL